MTDPEQRMTETAATAPQPDTEHDDELAQEIDDTPGGLHAFVRKMTGAGYCTSTCTRNWKIAASGNKTRLTAETFIDATIAEHAAEMKEVFQDVRGRGVEAGQDFVANHENAALAAKLAALDEDREVSEEHPACTLMCAHGGRNLAIDLITGNYIDSYCELAAWHFWDGFADGVRQTWHEKQSEEAEPPGLF